MPSPRPRPGPLLVAGVLLLAAGCGPSDYERFAGTWKADKADLGPSHLVWEFTRAGSYKITRVDPTPGKEEVEVVSAGRFRPGLGDSVTFLPDREKYAAGPGRATEKITVAGDKMTVGAGTDKELRFTRVAP